MQLFPGHAGLDHRDHVLLGDQLDPVQAGKIHKQCARMLAAVAPGVTQAAAARNHGTVVMRAQRDRAGQQAGVGRAQHRQRLRAGFVQVARRKLQPRRVAGQRIATQGGQLREQARAHAGFHSVTTTIAAMNTHSSTSTAVAFR